MLQDLIDDFRLYDTRIQLDLNFMWEPQEDPKTIPGVMTSSVTLNGIVTENI